MGTISRQFKTVFFAAALSLGLSRVAAAQAASTGSVQPIDTGSVQQVSPTVYRAKEPLQPPTLLPEIKVRAHSAHAIWISGYWDLKADPRTAPRGGWVWVPGRSIEPPVPGAHWDPAHWGFSDAWWSWIPGHWDDRARFNDES